MTNRLATNNQGQCYLYLGQLRKKHLQICNTYFHLTAAVIGMNSNTVYLLQIVCILYMVLRTCESQIPYRKLKYIGM